MDFIVIDALSPDQVPGSSFSTSLKAMHICSPMYREKKSTSFRSGVQRNKQFSLQDSALMAEATRLHIIMDYSDESFHGISQ